MWGVHSSVISTYQNWSKERRPVHHDGHEHPRIIKANGKGRLMKDGFSSNFQDRGSYDVLHKPVHGGTPSQLTVLDGPVANILMSDTS